MEETWIDIPLDRLQGRDPEAWSAFADAARTMLATFLRKLRVDYHQSEEIIQDCLLVAYSHLGTLRDPARLGTWLRAVARNRFLSSLRRERVRQVSLDNASEVSITDPPVDEGLPGLLRSEVIRLSASKRRIVELRLLDGFSPTEVEQLTGVSRDRQRRQLYKALTELRGRLVCVEQDRVALR